MATLLPPGEIQFIDGNGSPIAGGTVAFYIPNTLTPKDTYQDSGATILNTNPVVLDAAARAIIYGSGAYRMIVKDASGNLVYDQLTADTAVGGTAQGGTSTGAPNAQIIAASSFSQQNEQQIVFIVGPGLTNTGATTIAPGGGSGIPVLNDTPAGPVALTGAELVTGNAYLLTYDTARGAFHVSGSQSAATTFADNVFNIYNASDPTKKIAWDAANLTTGTTRTTTAVDKDGTQVYAADLANLGMLNGTLVTSVAAGALTIAIKTLAGNDPSTGDPVFVAFRDATAGTGDYVVLTVSSSAAITIPSGAVMGFTNAVIGRIWIVGINNAGTFQLGVINVLSGTSVLALSDDELLSATAISTAADNAQVLYSTSSVTTKPIRLLGYLEATEATAGTWATAPSKVQLFGAGVKKPGDRVQLQRSATGTSSSGNTTLPFDNTIPQVTEGIQFMSETITPQSGADLIEVRHQGLYNSTGSNGEISVALFLNGATNAVAAMVNAHVSANSGGSASLTYAQQAATTSAMTFTIRAGTSGGNIQFNASFGGAAASFLEVEEIMA